MTRAVEGGEAAETAIEMHIEMDTENAHEIGIEIEKVLEAAIIAGGRGRGVAVGRRTVS